jgi:hypothetical protein
MSAVYSGYLTLETRHRLDLFLHGFDAQDLLAGRDTVLGKLHVEERRAVRLAGKLAGGQRNHRRHQIGLHLDDGMEWYAALDEIGFQDRLLFRLEVIDKRISAREIHQVRFCHQRCRGLLLVQHFVGFEHHGASAIIGGLRFMRQVGDARVRKMDRTEQPAGLVASHFQLPEAGIGILDLVAFRPEFCVFRRVLRLEFGDEVPGAAGNILGSAGCRREQQGHGKQQGRENMDRDNQRQNTVGREVEDAAGSVPDFEHGSGHGRFHIFGSRQVRPCGLTFP